MVFLCNFEKRNALHQCLPQPTSDPVHISLLFFKYIYKSRLEADVYIKMDCMYVQFITNAAATSTHHVAFLSASSNSLFPRFLQVYLSVFFFSLLIFLHTHARTHARTCPHMPAHARTCPHVPTWSIFFCSYNSIQPNARSQLW